MTFDEIVRELELAALELGDDAPLEGELLDLAVIAMAMRATERENGPAMRHFDSPAPIECDELLLHGAWWRIIGWEKRKEGTYRISVEKA